jgi:hypothetical protein
MAFAATQTGMSIFGNLKVHYGTYTQENGDTGGDIATGLTDVASFFATAAATVSDSHGTVTITTADPGADASGYWMAYGY